MRLWVSAFLISLIWLSNALAAVDVLVWQPTPEHPRYLLPLKPGETPREAVESYRALLFSQSPLAQVVPPSSFQDSKGPIGPLPKGRDKTLFIANTTGDHSAEAKRARNFMNQLPQTDNYLLAVGAAERLRPEQRQSFYQKIIQEFAGLVSMGGQDVAPEAYNEKLTHAREFNFSRDALEIELIRAYVAAEKGFIFGVCRGHQITSVALGYKLVQDIPIETSDKTNHANNDHKIRLLNTSQRLLLNMVNERRSFDVYSWHHQSVVFRPGGPLELAAISRYGTTEALEFKNGKGLLVQFHPELKLSPESQDLLQGVWENVRKNVGTFSCRRVLSN